MKKLIEHYSDYPASDKNIDKHDYIKYRVGRIKHELWLKNRKDPLDIYIDQYDWFVVNNLKPGNTCYYCSAGYYLDEVIENLTVIENANIVKKFYPNAEIITEKSELKEKFPRYFSNFVVTNSRSDHWKDGILSITEYIGHYVSCLKPGGLLFYSMRDTQIPNWNRFLEDHEMYFLQFANNLCKLYDLNLIWHDIQFATKEKDGNGDYDILENPDSTNGNIKFIFEFKSNSHQVNDKYLNE